MIPDLLRALPAALLVGLVPGWFWTRVLYPGDAPALRLVCSMALSIALVPAVALVPARMLGMGVTLPAAALSAAAVFGAGLVAYLRFGPAEGPEEPLAPRPAFSPVLPVLASLILSCAIMLATSFGVVPVSWALPLLALLLVFAVVRHRSAVRRAEAGSRSAGSSKAAEEGKPFAFAPGSGVRRLLLPAVLAAALVRGYAGVVLHDWPFIRGVDHYSHAVMANEMLKDGEIFPYLIYPPGFHTMTAIVSQLSGLRPLEIFPVLGPALLVLPALSLYALGRRLWGWECGVAAAFFAGLVLNGPYEYFSDAMYPNMVTSQFLLVMAVAALFELYARPSGRSGLLFALVGSSVVLYHQVASLYLALLLALVSALLLPLMYARDRRRGVALLLSLAALGLLSLLYAWDTYDLPGAVAGLLLGGSGDGGTGEAVGMAVGSQLPFFPTDLVGTVLTQPVTWLGLLGASLLLAGAGAGKGTPYPLLVRVTLLLWLGLLVAGARTSLSGFPQRFARDLGMPLALLAALAFVCVLGALVRRGPAAPRLPLSLAALLMVAAVGVQAALNLKDSTGEEVPLTFANGLTITPEIAAAGGWLAEHNDGGNIMVSPQANQVPSRMMLAMGGYSALQSFTEHNLSVGRDLPPSGAGPLWDVLWVMNHPGGEHTERLLEKHDVRYVVLYKDMPDRPVVGYWALFEARPDLYRTAFENEDVLVVRPRNGP